MWTISLLKLVNILQGFLHQNLKTNNKWTLCDLELLDRSLPGLYFNFC